MQVGTSSLTGARFAWLVLTCTLFALMTGVFARIAVPLPFTPVPFTLQPLAVILTGLLLGSRLGAAAMLEYLALGAIGAPVFQGGTAGLYDAAAVTGTLGYLVSYPIAAWVIGRLSEHGKRSLARLFAAGAAGLAVIYGLGVLYLAGWLNVTAHIGGWDLVPKALIAGIFPFVLFDLLKAAIAAGAARRRLFE